MGTSSGEPSDDNAGKNELVSENAEVRDEDEEEDEYEEVEVEVDYTVLDHAQDAIESLGTWRDVAQWRDTLGSPTAVRSAVGPISAAPGGALGMAPSSGIAVALAFALGALFGRRQAEESGVSRGLAELMKREGGGIPG